MNLNSIVQQLQAERQQQASGVTGKAVTGKTATVGTASAADSDATITANDFITLLVSELKNQDPTSDTDPNAYVNQLVNVNSLQQLISIDQGITSLDTATGATSTGTSTGSGTGAATGAVEGTNGSSPSARVSQQQVASAQASYAAFEPASLSSPGGVTDQLSLSQSLNSSNPVLNTHPASANLAVPSAWRTGSVVSS